MNLAGPSLHDMLQLENILFVEEENNENKELEGSCSQPLRRHLNH